MYLIFTIKIYDFNLYRLTKLYACVLKCKSSEWPSMPYASLCVCLCGSNLKCP